MVLTPVDQAVELEPEGGVRCKRAGRGVERGFECNVVLAPVNQAAWG